MIRQAVRRLFWRSQEERWWGDHIFVALAAASTIWLWIHEQWLYGVIALVAIMAGREILYHLLVRTTNRRNKL